MSERKELQPVEVVRDAEGYWTHPDLEELLKTANEEFATAAEWNAFKQQQNIETRNIGFDGDDGNGDPDISSWNPAKPEGHGWFMLSLHDTVDGALCIWARKNQLLMSSEQERFEQSIATILYPARFTKVGENPILGWNVAKDTDYISHEMQLAWTTWQAATAQAVPEGYVVVPKKPTKNMINQGYEAHDGFFTNGAVVGVWEAMIKAALEQNQ